MDEILSAPSEPGRPTTFWDVLHSAAASGWSGQIEALDEQGEAGLVVFHQGRIAWAVSRHQTENLGAFLARIGKLAPEQIRAAQAKYRAEGGRRKLGAILEQDHRLERPVLRHCLRLHTRRAVDSLACRPRLTLQSGTGPRVVEDELTFPLEDFLPSVPPG
ncbi:MAG: hypothetical protein JXR96_24585 [Deltaproteobacteria bacterium]|nr:hypothetical protein [Deltaproteobacteria bacterium]